MSLMYIANNKNIPNLDLNVSGCDILGDIGAECNFKISSRPLFTNRIPINADNDACIAFAKAIPLIPTVKLLYLYNKHIEFGYFDGTYDDYNDFIKEFIEFFSLCGGYTVI